MSDDTATIIKSKDVRNGNLKRGVNYCIEDLSNSKNNLVISNNTIRYHEHKIEPLSSHKGFLDLANSEYIYKELLLKYFKDTAKVNYLTTYENSCLVSDTTITMFSDDVENLLVSLSEFQCYYIDILDKINNNVVNLISSSM